MLKKTISMIWGKKIELRTQLMKLDTFNQEATDKALLNMKKGIDLFFFGYSFNRYDALIKYIMHSGSTRQELG